MRRSSAPPCGTSSKQNSARSGNGNDPRHGNAPSQAKSGADNADTGTARKPGIQNQIRKTHLRCNNKYDADTKYETPTLTDQQIKTAFIDAVHQLIADQTQADELLDTAIMEEVDTTDLRIEADQLLAEYEEIISRISNLEDQQAGYQHYKSKIEKLDQPN